MRSVGIDRPSAVTVLSDRLYGISRGCKLSTATVRVPVWIHIGMRFEQFRIALTGLVAVQTPYEV